VSVLCREKQLAVLAALVEGNSERATERMTSVGRQAVGRFSLLAGEGAQRLHDRLVRDLSCSLIQVDEIWSYVKKKEARVTPKDGPDVGEAYTFVALDATSRMVIAFLVGKRDQESTDLFIADLRARLLVMPQMTADGYAPYITAIGASFGPGVDFAQTIKNYHQGAQRGPDHRYEPPREPFITKKTIFGAPDMKRASTAYTERNNCTMRHHIGRMRRLCLAFSKKLENHRAAVALNYAWYNLGTIVRTLRVTPAMQAGVTDHVWTLDEFLDAVLSEPAGEKPVKQALTHRAPEVPARELPNGRGFLRIISGGKGAAAPTLPEAPTPAPVAPAMPSVEAPAAVDDRQLDLLAWKRPAPKRGQLSLFGEPEGGE